MKIYNTKIKDIILNIIEQHTQLILWEKERFEEVINEYSVHYCEECYLINKAIEIGLFEVLLLNRHIPYEEHIEMLKITDDLKEEEALFMISIMDRVIKENEWFIQVVNIEEATKKALEECRARDLHVIALAYYDGLGTQQDYEKAYNLFLKASEYGDDKAYYYLGYMNANGLGVETNREQALAFYKEVHDIAGQRSLRYPSAFRADRTSKKAVPARQACADGIHTGSGLIRSFYNAVHCMTGRKDHTHSKERFHRQKRKRLCTSRHIRRSFARRTESGIPQVSSNAPRNPCSLR